jgi:hypothetical protein
MATNQPRRGTDTATGTDPNAKYETPGYEDKSFGQAVKQDQELADQLVEDADGDLDAAEDQFDGSATGAPARARQEGVDHRTGPDKARTNRAEDPPA